MSFYAFEQQKPGTIPIAVGHAEYSAGWKYRVSEKCTFAGDNGWAHDFVFYAYPADTSLLMPVSMRFIIILQSFRCQNKIFVQVFSEYKKVT